MSISNAAASPRDPAPARGRVERLLQGVDNVVVRIAERTPSTRILVGVLGVSLITLLFLGLTDGKPRGIHTTPDTEPLAAAGADSRPAPAAEAPVTDSRPAAPVASAAATMAPGRSDVAATVVPPAASPVAATAAPVQRMDVVRTNAPPRVVDMARSEPLSSSAADIVRAEPARSRVADAPRAEAPVAASRVAVEGTVSPAPRNREAVDATRDEPPRPAPERAPSSEGTGGPGL